MKRSFLLCFLAVIAGVDPAARAADPLFSGPQIGERTTAFQVLELMGANEGTDRDPVTENAGAPIALVFVHAIERSLVPLLRAVDQYGAERKDGLKTEVVFLFGDRVEGERRIKAAARSLQLHSRVGLSLDGAEGPGNYGLNKECMMTIVAANANKVTANFALVQPGIADAPKIIQALAKTCGDTAPPTVEQLTQRQMARTGGGQQRPERMGRDRARIERGLKEPLDFSQFDLNSEAGLRDALRALIAEVQGLRAELANLQAPGGATDRIQNPPRPKDELPGAAPDDPKLNSLLRQFIRPTNDDATVDKLLTEVKAHIHGNADLTQQAINGWRRVLHFGDRYGTPYARKVGQEFLNNLQSGAPQQ